MSPNHIDLNPLSKEELVALYGDLIRELKKRQVIHSNNLIGDLGEYVVVNYYNTHPPLTKLTVVAPGTTAFDATGRNGKRYTIKTTSGRVTGVVLGLPNPIPPGFPSTFDFMLILKLDPSYSMEFIAELSWDDFLIYKKWLPYSNAYNVPITNKMFSNGVKKLLP